MGSTCFSVAHERHSAVQSCSYDVTWGQTVGGFMRSITAMTAMTAVMRELQPDWFVAFLSQPQLAVDVHPVPSPVCPCSHSLKPFSALDFVELEVKAQ